MGRLYTVSFTDVAATAAQDLFEIAPADDSPIALHALFLAQSTELAEAQEEQIRVSIIRGFTTSGSGGSTPTPRPLSPLDTAAAFAAEANNTTVATTGTTHTLHEDAWNVRAGLQLIWTPEMRPICSQAQSRIVVRIPAPADSITISGTLYVEELA